MGAANEWYNVAFIRLHLVADEAVFVFINRLAIYDVFTVPKLSKKEVHKNGTAIQTNRRKTQVGKRGS